MDEIKKTIEKLILAAGNTNISASCSMQLTQAALNAAHAASILETLGRREKTD